MPSPFRKIAVSSLRLRSTEHRTPVPAQDSVCSTRPSVSSPRLRFQHKTLRFQHRTRPLERNKPGAETPFQPEKGR